MQTKTNGRTELYVAHRKSIPVAAFEETHEGRQLWAKHVRLARIIDRRDDGAIDLVAVDAAVYSLCKDPKVKQVWMRSDDRSEMMFRCDRPAGGGSPISRTEKAAALARGEITNAEF